jgi:hypothetical protein
MRTSILILSCLGLGLLTSGAAQRRVKQAGPADFETTVKAAVDAFKEGRHAASIAQLNAAIDIARVELTKGVLSCLIEAPAGYKVEDEDTSQGNAAARAFIGGMAGSQIERRYKSEGKDVTITAHIDSAMIQTMSMMFDNPAFRPQGAEPVEYEGAKALLMKDEHALKVIIEGKHYFEIKGDVGEDELIKFFPQATIDKLRKVLKG